MALASQPGTGALFAAVHGRDQLADNWGFSNEVNANNPAEELVRVESGGDYGWPYCYYSNQYQKKVLAPEYGGDGEKVGRCSTRQESAGCLSRSLGANGAGVLPLRRLRVEVQGWAVRRVPRVVESRAAATGGLPGGVRPLCQWRGRPASTPPSRPTREDPPSLRASGVAVAPDGSLYISADQNGKIWKVSKSGKSEAVNSEK